MSSPSVARKALRRPWRSPAARHRTSYLATVLPHRLHGTIDPVLGFDRELALDDIAEAYHLMDSCVALNAFIQP
jgi:hypothetical protein